MLHSSSDDATPRVGGVMRSAQLQQARDAATYADAWLLGAVNHLDAARASGHAGYLTRYAARLIHSLLGVIEREMRLAQAQERQALDRAVVSAPPVEVERARDAHALWLSVYRAPGDARGLWS